MVILAPLLLLLQGCIEIVEEITVNKDKSGHVSYRLETEGAGGLISGLTGLFDISIEDAVRQEAEKLVRELQHQEGISNIRYSLGRSGNYFLEFDFAHYRDFNHAVYSLGGSKKTIFTPGYLRIGSSRFRKFNFAPWINRYIKKEEIAPPSPFLSDNVYFKSCINTPEDIKSVRNGSYDAGKNPRRTVQRFRLSDILSKEINTGIRIRY